MRRSAVLALPVLVVLAIVWATDRRPEPPPPPGPDLTLPVPTPPIEHWLDDKAEGVQKTRRKAWFAEIHRAPPGVDWSLVDRELGLARMQRRAALRANPPVIAPVVRWQERGSDNQSGRAHVVAHSTDGNRLYVGSSLGGVWKGSVHGEGWTPIGDGLYGGAHHLVVLSPASPGAPDVVLAASNGGLVHRTVDDGATWTPPSGLPWGSHRTLIRTSDGRDIVFAVRDGDANAVYRSVDAGRSFVPIHHCGDFACDVWLPRTGDATLYLVDSGVLLASVDDGDTFLPRGTVDAEAVGARLTGSEAGAPTLYAMVDDGASVVLHRSDDAGVSWGPVYNDVSDYWGRLAASIRDPAIVAWGGVEVHVSRDGGQAFDIVNPWWAYYDDIRGKLHADVMGLDVVPDGEADEIWYVSTDGGPYRSFDQLAQVENLSMTGLRISQYYSTLTSVANPYHVAAGSQDQGYQLTQGFDQDDALWEFDQVISGDYGHLVSGDGTHDTVFSVYPGFILVQRGEDKPQLVGVDYPDQETSYAWLPPIQADPDEPTSFYFPGAGLWRYDYDPEVKTWVPGRWSEQRFGEVDGEYISAIEFSPVDSERMYVATNRGRLFRSTDHGRSWQESASLGPQAHYFYGHALHASITDVDVAVVGGSGYGQTSVYRTVDGGRTWAPWDTGLGETHVYALEEAPDGSGRVFAGTQQAAYQRGRDDRAWVDVTGTDAPLTIYWSVEALQSENTLRFGTYGRGIWDLQLDAEGTGCFPIQDFDGDGVSCDLDCDDADATRTPGIVEAACDLVDTNCDPAEEADGDGDGAIACADCNDADATVFPGAEDIPADGIDQDCDGMDAERTCGCASGAAPGGWGLLLGALVGAGLIRRRRAA